MIRLNLSNEPEWLELLPGLQLKLAPLTTAMMVAARVDPGLAELPETASTEDLALGMARALARLAILDWEGVGDGSGAPLPVTPEGIDALLELWPVFEAFQAHYVARGLMLDGEKNGSAPLPSGPSAGARAIARPAKGSALTAPHD